VLEKERIILGCVGGGNELAECQSAIVVDCGSVAQRVILRKGECLELSQVASI
jgi:hypothetical protein